MKVCWTDIETTGLDPEKNQILEIGIVIDDLERLDVPVEQLPFYHCYVMPSDGILLGNPIALAMNAEILGKIAGEMKRKPTEEPAHNFVKNHIVAGEIYDFVLKNQAAKLDEGGTPHGPVTIVCGGKNFARFDEKFLSKLPDWNRYLKVRHRVLDPVNFFLEVGDKEPPDLKICLKRAGLPNDVPHNAVEDARLACQVYRVGLQRMWIANGLAQTSGLEECNRALHQLAKDGRALEGLENLSPDVRNRIIASGDKM